MSEQPPPGSVPPGSVPPGSVPPGSPPPGTPPPGGYGPGPDAYPPPPQHQFAPAHKPGIIALRPLGLGDFYDGAFKLIRRNPKPMIGLAALVTTAFMVLPAVISVLLASTGRMSADLFTADPAAGSFTRDEFYAQATTLIALYSGTFFGVLATIVLNGMIVHVVADGVLGRKSGIGEAWRAARGRLLHLAGLTVVNLLAVLLLLGAVAGIVYLAFTAAGVGAAVAVGILLGIVAVCVLAFVQVRLFQLAAPALMLERCGVFSAMGRSWQLSRNQFWRLFGIYLLTSLVVGLVAGILGLPFSALSVLGPLLTDDPVVASLLLVFSNYLSQIIVGAVTTPFTSAVVALQYVDQRIRKEGFDVDLISRAQQTSPTLF